MKIFKHVNIESFNLSEDVIAKEIDGKRYYEINNNC